MISGSCLPKSKVLITSRPSIKAKLQSLSQTATRKEIEVVGFSQEEIQEYANESFKSKPKLLDDFQRYLSANAVVRGMLYNPLSLAIVVAVYRYSHKSGKLIPHTLTQLYSELTLHLLSRYLERAGDPWLQRYLNNLRTLTPTVTSVSSWWS